jgi:hypothetical protein
MGFVIFLFKLEPHQTTRTISSYHRTHALIPLVESTNWGLVQTGTTDTTLVQQVSTTRTTPTSPKQDYNSPKEDNLAHKLDPEKLET